MRTDHESSPVLALVRPKEARVCHAHGQVFRRNHPVEVQDPVLLRRIQTDGSLAVTLTEAGRAFDAGTVHDGSEARAAFDAVPSSRTERVEPFAIAAAHDGSQVNATCDRASAVTAHDDPEAAGRTPGVLDVDPPRAIALLEACREPRTRKEVQAVLGLTHRQHVQRHYLDPLLAAGLLERTIPDKPRSRNQQYRTTEAGLAWLAQARKQV